MAGEEQDEREEKGDGEEAACLAEVEPQATFYSLATLLGHDMPRSLALIDRTYIPTGSRHDRISISCMIT